MPPTHPSQADVAAAYRTLIAHETEPKEQDFYRTRLQRLEPTTEPVCELDCRSRLAAAGVGVYCPQCSAKCADTDLTTQLAKALRAAWVDRLDWDELAQGALEFLTTAGRLIPAGGMALTAEQVEDVRFLLGLNGSQDIKVVLDAQARLRALFPATEPAEDAPCAICNVNETNHAGVSYYHPFTTEPGPFDDEGNDRPTPAEPAEEETKAELCAVRLCVLPARHSGVHADREGLRWNTPASSPVVPAPTETGPWQRIEDVPETVGRLTDRDGDVWEWDGDNWVTPETAILPTTYINRKYAPFVAAEEG